MAVFSNTHEEPVEKGTDGGEGGGIGVGCAGISDNASIPKTANDIMLPVISNAYVNVDIQSIFY